MACIDPALVNTAIERNGPYHEQLRQFYKASSCEWSSPDNRLDCTGLNLYDEPPLLDRRDSAFSPPVSQNQDSKEQVRRHKRKQQNRHAQRLYRERKVQRITELEQKIINLRENVSDLRDENSELELRIRRIKTENDVIRSSMSDNANEDRDQAAASIEFRPQPRRGILLRDALTVYGGMVQQP